MVFRKKRPDIQTVHESISLALRAVSQAITEGNFVDALNRLDQLAATSLGSDRACQVAALAALVQFEKGHFVEAAATYRKAWQIGADTQEVWFIAALGIIRSNLRNVEIEAALAVGKETLAEAVEKRASYDANKTAAAQTFAQQGSALVAGAPLRPSVVATRIGEQFWREGEPAHAATFFTEARRLEPDGACKAVIALARIQFINESYQAAYDLAKEAINLGQYHAKTLSAWPILIAASQKLGNPGIDIALSNGLAQATPTVRGRARLVIVRALREWGDPSWEQFASVVPGEDDGNILAAEFAKLRVATDRTSRKRTRAEKKQAAQALSNVPNLGPTEWLSAAKALVVQQIADGQAPDISALARKGVKQFGKKLRPGFEHGLALACAKAGRIDLAISALQHVTSSPANANPKSLTLLAKLNLRKDDPAAAAPLFQLVSQRTDVSPRFRLIARLDWLRCLALTNNAEAIAAAAPALRESLQSISDYELLLDMARQLTQAPGEAAQLAQEVFNRGVTLATQAFNQENNPASALDILFKLTRRQSDFGQYVSIVAGWMALSTKQRDWLWTQDSQYWEYLDLVATGYRTTDQPALADSHARKYLDDPATPPTGLATLGIPYALSLLARGDKATAFEWLDWLTGQAPTHVLCAYAYYWQALRASAANNVTDAKTALSALHLCLGNSFTLGWMNDLDARSRMLEGSTPEQLVSQSSYPLEYLQAQWEQVQRDKARL